MTPEETLKFVLQKIERVSKYAPGRFILAGGCVRDRLLGKVPKDYDAFLLGYDGEGSLESETSLLKKALLFHLGASTVTVHDAYRESKGRLMWVVQAVFQEQGQEVRVDFIAYTSCPSTGYDQVREFDCTLNMCFYDDDGLIVLEEHPIVTGVVRPLRSLDGDWELRKEYLRTKYPQFEYSDEVLS